MRIPLGMLPDGHESLSRDASVMPKPSPCAATPLLERNGGYAIVSPAASQLSENGSDTAVGSTHSEPESSPRADAVMTRSRSVDARLAASRSGCADIRTTCTRSTAFVSTAGAALSSQLEVSSAFSRRHRRAVRHLRAARTHRTFRYFDAARVRARVDDSSLALRSGVAGARLDRAAGVGLESLRFVSRQTRLLLQRLQLVRDPAGEPVPVSVARPTRVDLARTSALADLVREAQVRLAVSGARVPARARLVLTGGASPRTAA